MELQYSGAELDAESFQALQEELAAQTEAAAASFEESLQKNLAAAKVTFDGGGMNLEEYNTAVNAFYEEYLSAVSELEGKSLDFRLAYSRKTGGFYLLHCFHQGLNRS